MLRRADVAVRSPRRPPRGLPAILSLVRPSQWTKNLLCLAAPAAAGVLASPGPLLRALTATVAFTLAAGAVYAANDVADVACDREHLTKRRRPVASGAVSRRAALAVSAVCAGAGLLVAETVGWLTVMVVAIYLVSSAGYVLHLRRVPVLDVVTVAVGFVLRALAGAAATHLEVSSWFLLVALFGSLFLVCAKRRAELSATTSATSAGRASLREYSVGWLDQVLTLSLSGTVLAYAMWAFQPQGADVIRSVLAVSVLPVLVALLRYLLMVDHGSGERPEHTIVDPTMVGCAVLWCTLLITGLYLS
jgi:decaprenyl-phosphate phosphoribosyltransferase